MKKEEPISAAAMPRVTEREIVCGDCMGDDFFPRRTRLTVEGNCAGCGGQSFVLAARPLFDAKKSFATEGTERAESRQFCAPGRWIN